MTLYEETTGSRLKPFPVAKVGGRCIYPVYVVELEPGDRRATGLTWLTLADALDYARSLPPYAPEPEAA